MKPTDVIKRPYGRVVLPEPDGTFRAEIIEFPGCIAAGDTAAQALTSLEAVAESWLEATIAKGLRVPEPIESTEYSGKLVVRLPKTLHKKAAHAAAREGVSLIGNWGQRGNWGQSRFICEIGVSEIGVRVDLLI